MAHLLQGTSHVYVVVTCGAAVAPRHALGIAHATRKGLAIIAVLVVMRTVHLDEHARGVTCYLELDGQCGSGSLVNASLQGQDPTVRVLGVVVVMAKRLASLLDAL